MFILVKISKIKDEFTADETSPVQAVHTQQTEQTIDMAQDPATAAAATTATESAPIEISEF